MAGRLSISSELSSQESVNGDDHVAMSKSKKGWLYHHHRAPSSSSSSSQSALEHSAAASQFLAAKDFANALSCYQKALDLYESQTTTVGQCNAAATLHNMALLHKSCRRYKKAVKCFAQAEDLYRDCSSRVVTVAQAVSPTTVAQDREDDGRQHVCCLEYLLVETLHNRAFVHNKYLHQVDSAIECHEQVVETILGMQDNRDNDNEESAREQPPATAAAVSPSQDVLYVKMTNEQRVRLLAESLKSLGALYFASGKREQALGALEEALEVLRCQVAECPYDGQAKKSMATVFINLASVHFGQDDWNEAFESLQHAMDLWMEVGEDPTRPDVLATVNNMGLAQERMGNLDKALECYEHLLHVRSQVHGTDHVDVADSLTTVAKVMERQGNTEGALDLYHEALRIYKKAANDEDPSLWANAADVLGRIGTILLKEAQVDESIDKFRQALEMAHHTLGETSEETAAIYHGLGRAYMAKQEYNEARECLLKAARMLEAVPNDGVHLDSLVESCEMLKHALNNESFLSSDGSWVNAEIDIQKTPERLALATAMSPIGESSLSTDPDNMEDDDDAPSVDFSSSLSSQQLVSSSSLSSLRPPSAELSQMQVYVHPSATVDGSINIEVSPLSTMNKKTPWSPNREEVATIEESETYLSPASHNSTSQASGPPNKVAVDARSPPVLDTSTVDNNKPLATSPAAEQAQAHCSEDPATNTLSTQPDIYTPIEETSPEILLPLLAAHQAVSHDSSVANESQTPLQETVASVQADLASMATLAPDKYSTVEVECDSVDDKEEDDDDVVEQEVHRRLMMEFSQYESETDAGTTRTADYTDEYTNASDVETADATTRASEVETANYTTDSSDDDSSDYTTTASEVETAGYTTDASDVETADYTCATGASDVETADYTRESDCPNDASVSYFDTPSQNLSSVAEQVDISESQAASTDGESHTRLISASAEASVRTENAVFRPQVESDRELSASGGNETSSVAPKEQLITEDSSSSASQRDMASAFSELDRATEGETDYRQLSTDNEESYVVDTGPDSDIESIPNVERSRVSPRHKEIPGSHLGESPRRQGHGRKVQPAVGGSDESAQAEDSNADNVDVSESFTGADAEMEQHFLSNGVSVEDDDNETNEPLLSNTSTSRKEPPSPRGANSPRVMLVKAFKQSFRRKSRSRTRLDSMPEDQEHNDTSVFALPDHSQPSRRNEAPIGPIPVIDLGASSFDDNVSQITFLNDEAGGRRRESSGSWWWGASSDGEGWFPAVVGAAEEFLSAKTIHDQIKSRKQDTSSSSSTDETESDVFGDLSVERTLKEEQNGAETKEEQVECEIQEERDIEVDVEGHINVTEPGAESTTVPVSSATKKSNELMTKNSPEAGNTEGSSTKSAIRRRSTSSGRRPKVQELEQLLESQQNELGDNHPDVADTLTSIAVLMSRDGEKDAPVEMLHEALLIRKSIGDRAEFARTLHKLGDVYARQGEFKSSLSCHTDALHLERLTYGYQNEEVAKTLNRIGSVNARQGEFAVAISNHQHALQILKECVGEDLSHPLVAQTLICIGAVYYKERNSLETIRANSDGYSTFIEAGMLGVIARAHEQRGSYRMAIAFFEEKLQLLKSQDKRGMNKHEVADALSRLGTLSREAGLYLEALDYYDEASNIQLTAGRDQIEIAKGFLLKATVLYHLGQYKESLQLLSESQSVLQATVGNDQQVLTAETLRWIGLVQTELCDFDSATKTLNSATKIEKRILGVIHPSTLKTRSAIAILMLHRGEMDAAIEALTGILEIQGRVHGPKHPNLAETMYYIGRAYEMKGDIVSAVKFFEESFFMAEEFLGHDHPSQASTLHSIADLQRKKRRYKKSLQLLTSVLAMRKDTLGDKHVSVAMTMCSIGACHAATGRFAESTQVLNDALTIAERAMGKTHPYVALIHVSIGHLYLRKCQFEQAREMIEKGLEIYVSSKVAKNHPNRLEAENMLARCDHDEALCV